MAGQVIQEFCSSSFSNWLPTSRITDEAAERCGLFQFFERLLGGQMRCWHFSARFSSSSSPAWQHEKFVGADGSPSSRVRARRSPREGVKIRLKV